MPEGDCGKLEACNCQVQAISAHNCILAHDQLHLLTAQACISLDDKTNQLT